MGAISYTHAQPPTHARTPNTSHLLPPPHTHTAITPNRPTPVMPNDVIAVHAPDADAVGPRAGEPVQELPR